MIPGTAGELGESPCKTCAWAFLCWLGWFMRSARVEIEEEAKNE